jgi:hypothetical protein|eukprot:g7044.t1
MLRAILFLSIVLKARGIIDSSADVTVKVFSGLALRIEDGSFFVADTPGAIPGSDLGLHAAVGDKVTGVDDIPLSMESLSSILSRDNAYAVLPLVEGGLYSPHNTTFKVRGFVKIQTFSATSLNIRPTNDKRRLGIEKEHEKELKHRRVVEEEHKRLDAKNRNLQQQIYDNTSDRIAKVDEEKVKKQDAADLKEENNAKAKEKRDEMKSKQQTKKAQADYDKQVKQAETSEKRGKEQSAKARERKAAKAVEQKAKATKRKELPDREYFNVVFQKEGPMGIWFQPNVYPPTIDAQQGRNNRLRLKTGDILFSLNDELVEKEGTLSDFLSNRLLKASFPRTLRFGRKKKRKTYGKDGKETSSFIPGTGYLEILWPKIMAFKYDILRAGFGSNLPCRALNISYADPLDACKSGSQNKQIAPSSIMLALRGICTFSVKALTGQAWGAESVLMINNAKDLSVMPAGRRPLNDLKISMAMVGSSNGAVLKEAVKLLEYKPRGLKGKFATLTESGEIAKCKGSEGDDTPDETAVAVSPDGESQEDSLWKVDFKNSKDSVYGKLIIWDGEETHAFKFQMGNFGGKNFPLGPFILKLATPLDACKGMRSMVKGSVVIIERGKCQFLDKAKLSQGSGGIGLFILNTEDSLFPAPADRREAAKITIPIGTLPSAAKETLKRLAEDGKKAIIGRVLVPANAV